MNLLRGSLVALGMCLIGYTGLAQEKKDTVAAKTDTLKLSVAQTQQYALENNRAIRASKYDIEIAKKKVWETTAIGLPQLNASADYQHLFTIPTISFPVAGFSQNQLTNTNVDKIPGFTQSQPFNSVSNPNPSDIWMYMYNAPAQALSPQDNVTYTFTLSQLIFSGEYIVGLQASRVYKELSEKSFVKSEENTKESVANSYYMILVFNEMIDILQETLKSVEKSYVDMVGMNQQGFSESSDVDQLKVNKANIQASINSLKNQRLFASKLLHFQLGIDFTRPLVLTDSLSPIIQAENGINLALNQFDVNYNVDYQLALTNENLMSLSLKREKSKFLPTVSAFYRHQSYMIEPAIQFQPKDVIGASLNLPILTSGSRLSKIGQARLELEKARLAKEDAAQGLSTDFDKSKNDYLTAYDNFTNNKESARLSHNIYNKNVIKFHEGVISSLELTQSQNQYLNSESSYYNSVLALLSAKNKLNKMLTKYQKPN